MHGWGFLRRGFPGLALSLGLLAIQGMTVGLKKLESLGYYISFDALRIAKLRCSIAERDKGYKGPFIATQLNSTRRRVELSCVGEVSIATQLNSTDLLRADWLYAATGSVALPIAGDS